MDKETLSNYGWIVVCVMILAVLLALASPFGNFVANAIKSTTQGLFDVNQGALGATGITIPGQSMGDSVTGENSDQSDPSLNPNDGSTPQEGDIYRYGNYEYCYGLGWCLGGGDTWSSMCPEGMCGCYNTTSGWGVRCLNNVSDPGPILESINGQPITSLFGTFYNCTALTKSPIIPKTVSNITSTFCNCTSLTEDGMPQIPDDITSMRGTFAGCTSLNDLSTYSIPDGVTSMEGTFDSCTSLEVVPQLPNNLNSMYQTFYGCTALTDLSDFEIPSTVTNLDSTFSCCTNLTAAPSIPEGVTSMIWTFYYCENLESAPVLPSTVTDIQGVFERCSKLKTYHGSTDPDGDFSAYIIPSGVTNMHTTFEFCGSLTSAPTIPDGVKDMSRTFNGCDLLQNTIEIPCTCTEVYGIGVEYTIRHTDKCNH